MKSSGFLIFSFLVGICSGKEQENCRQVEMNPAKQDFILEKHVFKMVEIETASACEVNCFMEADCVSYNLKLQQNGKLLCELSDSDHANNQQDLRYREGTVYKSFKNRCSSMLCPSTKRCQTGFTRKGYRCVCTNGLLGENCTEGSPLVQVVPDIIETVEGRNVTIMCNVTANPKPDRIIWTRSDGILSSARTIVSEGNLTILNITFQDNDSYVCTATNPWGTKSSSVHLRVYSALKLCTEGPPLVEVIPNIIETVEGRNVTIMCNVTANPKPGGIIWKKSDGILSSARTFVREGNITILNVTTQDNGSYVCTATNPCSTKSSSVLLRVYSALKFVIKPPSNVTVMAYKAVILRCSASSDLMPTILWTYNETFSLPSGAAVDSLNALIILSANISHSGTYTCNATDAFSSIQTSVTVHVKYPETCSKLKAIIGDVSGDYLIDPDGDFGEDPFPVYCNMTDKGGVGVTVVSHNSENRTQVKGYDGPGEYSLDVHYRSANISQLKALTEASSNCQQFIKYECFHARLNKGGFSWWVSRDGQNMTYWGGANLTAGGCACGLTGSCADNESLKCNCDKNDKKWREDSGFLTIRSHLPVKQLRFGDTGHKVIDEEGYHTLGKLECYGLT